MSGDQETAARADQGTETAKLCHDLRQYVAAGMVLSGSREAAGVDAETKRRLDTIAHIFEGMSDMLDEEYHVRPRSTSVDVAVVVRECVELTRLVSKVPIDTDLPGPTEALANPSLLRRAVLNVLNNATRAAGVGGRVNVEVGRDGDDVWIEIGDDGVGFGRIPAVSGLGMAIVEAAVRSSHGSLEIVSGPAPGTRVRLRLPSVCAGGVRT